MALAGADAVYRIDGYRSRVATDTRGVDEHLALEYETVAAAFAHRQALQQGRRVEAVTALGVADRIARRPRDPEIRLPVAEAPGSRHAFAPLETRRDDDVVRVLDRRIDQARNILRPVLSVGIQSDHGIHGLLQGRGETAGQAGGLAEVAVVSNQRHRKAAKLRGGVVLGAVVDDKHCLCVAQGALDNLRHRGGLVVRRYEHRDTHGAGLQIIAPLMPMI